jgi:steroid delta-isomerase-like uncharacterized protein
MSYVDVHRRGHEAFNRRDYDEVVAEMTDDSVYVDHPRGLTMKGKGEFIEWMKDWVAAFSDAKVTDAQYLDAGDHTIATYTAQGTNDRAASGLPGDGKQMRVKFCEINRYDAEGRVVHAETFYDNATIMSQLGLMEAQPKAKRKAPEQKPEAMARH